MKIPQSEKLTLMEQLQMLNGTIKLTSLLLPQVVYSTSSAMFGTVIFCVRKKNPKNNNNNNNNNLKIE